MFVGYARVSSTEQETALQLDALRRAGVTRVFQEKRSAVSRRPELERLLYSLRAGDTLVVYKVDRLARSLSDLLRILDRVAASGAAFRSLTEPIETGTPVGRMMLHMLGAVAEFERSLIRERCMAGQDAAFLRGASIGRPRALSDAQQAECLSLWRTGEYTKTSLAGYFGVHLSSIKRVVLRVDKPESPAVRKTMALRVASSLEKKPAFAGLSS